MMILNVKRINRFPTNLLQLKFIRTEHVYSEEKKVCPEKLP